jgi:hypothetical protein
MFKNVPGTASSLRNHKQRKTDAADANNIYYLSFDDRKLLATGPSVRVVGDDNNEVIDLPLALFRAASTNKTLVKSNITIKLPPSIDVAVTKNLIQHLKDTITQNQQAKNLRPYESTFENLHLCSAADYVEIKIYTRVSATPD